MKFKLLAGLLLAGAVPFLFNACKDEEDPKTGIAFEKTEEEVMESDGSATSFHPDLWPGGKGHDVIVKLVLDRPLKEAVVLKYTLSGTAIATNPSGQAFVNDFSLKDGINTSIGSDKITIQKGATEATVKLTVYEDIVGLSQQYNDVETETVVLTIQSVESGPAVLGTNTAYTLTIREDDSILVLSWMDDATELVGDIDLDLFLWNEGEIIDGSANENSADPEESYEFLWLYGGYPEGDYGLSYTYYKGSSDNVAFAGIMLGYFNDKFYKYDGSGERLAYGGKYTKQNINTYVYNEDTEVLEPSPKIVQTMSKDGVYFYPSQVTVPSSGSRSGATGGLTISPRELKKFQDVQLAEIIRSRKVSLSPIGPRLNINK